MNGAAKQQRSARNFAQFLVVFLASEHTSQESFYHHFYQLRSLTHLPNFHRVKPYRSRVNYFPEILLQSQLFCCGGLSYTNHMFKTLPYVSPIVNLTINSNDKASSWTTIPTLLSRKDTERAILMKS